MNASSGSKVKGNVKKWTDASIHIYWKKKPLPVKTIQIQKEKYSKRTA